MAAAQFNDYNLQSIKAMPASSTSTSAAEKGREKRDYQLSGKELCLQLRWRKTVGNVKHVFHNKYGHAVKMRSKVSISTFYIHVFYSFVQLVQSRVYQPMSS